MSMKPIKKAVVTTGKYTDRKTGQEKNQYLTVGKLLQREDGSLCLKLDAIPVGFDGWINFYDLDIDQAKQGMAQAKKAAEPVSTDPFTDDDLPF